MKSSQKLHVKIRVGHGRVGLGAIGVEGLISQLTEELKPILKLRDLIEAKVELRIRRVMSTAGDYEGNNQGVGGVSEWMENQVGMIAKQSTLRTIFI